MIFDEFDIKSLIRPVPDFPKPGVVFRDITPLFQSPRAHPETSTRWPTNGPSM